MDDLKKDQNDYLNIDNIIEKSSFLKYLLTQKIEFGEYFEGLINVYRSELKQQVLKTIKSFLKSQLGIKNPTLVQANRILIKTILYPTIHTYLYIDDSFFKSGFKKERQVLFQDLLLIGFILNREEIKYVIHYLCNALYPLIARMIQNDYAWENPEDPMDYFKDMVSSVIYNGYNIKTGINPNKFESFIKKDLDMDEP